MTEEEEKRVRLAIQGYDIADILEILISADCNYDRRKLRFFRYFCMYFPIFVMFAHAYGVYDISQNPRCIFISEVGNIPCRLFVYTMVYIAPMIIVIASNFFHLCWRFKIPFFYFLGVNSIHIAYGSVFTTSEMITSHIVVGVMVLMFYLYGFAELFADSKIGRRLFI